MVHSCSRAKTALGVALLLPLGSLLGCSAEGGIRQGDYARSDSTGSNAGPSGGTGDASTSGGGGSSNGTSGTNGSGTSGGGTSTVPLPDGTDPVALIPARIRRLSNAEYDATAHALLGSETRPGQSFAPDARQAGFTVNDAQRVDAVLVKQLFAAAETLAVEARPRFGELAPCDSPDAAEGCAAEFIQAFGSKAYRRPLDTTEADGLLEVYRVGAEGASYEDGIELVIRALLQSAGFLYLTELGSGAQNEDGSVALTAYELANSLSYLMTAGPPDQTLVDAALSGKLGTPEGRVEELLRLRDEARVESDVRLTRFIREWLELDRIDNTAKDSNIYGKFDVVKPAMVTESHDFVQAVLDESGDVRDFLGANWTVTGDPDLLELYDASAAAGGRATMATRRGLLNQGAFLAVHAHAHESTPVLRGVAVARRLACLSIASPASLNINVVPPVPDPNLTTRERFAAHTADPECVQCHKLIDPFGNAFELFDGMGQHREPLENDRPVDSSTTIDLGKDFDGTYADSNELAAALAGSAEVRSCFARHVFRATVARSDDSVEAAEDAFVDEIESMPAEQQGNVMDTLMAYVSGPLFTHRRLP